MPASTGVAWEARLCCYPGPRSAPSVGWAQGVRKIAKHDDCRADRVRPLSLHKRLSRYLLQGRQALVRAAARALANAAATKLMAPLVQKDASRQVEGLIRTIDDRPAFRSSPQYILARGRSAGISPARRCTFRHLAATAVCPRVYKSDTWPRQTALIMPGSRVRVPPFPPIKSLCSCVNVEHNAR
jgi:hypothetical protein